MQTIDTIARIIGPLYFVVGLAMLLGPGNFRRVIDDYMKSPALCYVGGLIALVFGLIILTFHATWESPLAIVVGIIGWLAVAKGTTLIIKPDAFNALTRVMMGDETRLRIGGAVAVALGGYMEAAAHGLI